MNFNTRQKKVIEAKDKHILCLASAGSGKTTTLIERVKQLILKGTNPEKIVCISFTNMAADEIKKKLGDISIGMFVGTVHSYANLICVSNGLDTSQYTLDMAFDKILEKALTLPKKAFPKIEHLLVDEFQDISSLEFRFLERIPTENFLAIGDNRQNIYQFRGCTDQYLQYLYENEDVAKYYLSDSYRCAPNILRFADKLIASSKKMSPPPQAIKTKNGVIEECGFGDALEELEWAQDWGNWCIICRTNNELATAITRLENKHIPCVSFKKGDLDLIEMEALLRDNRVKILTVHSSKGLEFKKVIVVGAKTFNEEERKIAYVAATRAEQYLYWCPSICGRGKKNRPANRDIADAGNIHKKMAKTMMSFE